MNISITAFRFRPCPSPARLLVLLSILLTCLAPLLDLPAPPAAAQGAVDCDRFASADGDDSHPGTADAPVSSIRRLADVLDPGETGCLEAGDEFVSPGDGSGSIGASGEIDQPITLRSGPGGRATMRGQFEVTGNNVILRDLNFHGYVPSAAIPNFKGKFLNVFGDNVEIVDNDITSEFGICVGAGSVPNNDQAKNFILDGNRIHGCGLENTFVPTDSGSHGAYIENTLDARITNNVFYDNRIRGLQLYPKAINTHVANNVMDGNSGNFNIGGENGNFPQGNLVENNIITNSTFTGNNKDSHEVFGYYPNNGETYGNVVRDNCVFNKDHPSQLFGGYGYVGDENTNVIADPLYVDADNNDFSLQPESPCLGKGPDGSGEPVDTGTDTGSSTDGSSQDAVSLTILNVDENDEPLVHSCFQIYEEGVDIFAVAPIADLCDAQDDVVDAQVTFELEPGTYILHQSWVDVEGYVAMEPQTITVDMEPDQLLTVQTLPETQDVVSLTILNVDENDEPLVHSCFQIYEEGVDIFAASPLADLCDGQDEAVDGQVTFELEPGTYILHQSWVDVEGYVAMEPQTITVGADSIQTLTIRSLPESGGGNGTGTGANGGRYESPTYGYTLSYDDEAWEILFEDGNPSDPYDEIYLYNGTSIIGLTGDPDYTVADLDDCIDDYARSMERDGANSEIAPLTGPDAAGSTDDAAWATFTYVYTGDSGGESDWVRSFECRAIGEDLTLVITQDVPFADFEDEVAAREELLEGLALPR